MMENRTVTKSWVANASVLRVILFAAASFLLFDHISSVPVVIVLTAMAAGCVIEFGFFRKWGERDPRFAKLQQALRLVDGLLIIGLGLLPLVYRENLWLLGVPIMISEAIISRSLKRVLGMAMLLIAAQATIEVAVYGQGGTAFLSVGLLVLGAGASIVLAGYKTREEKLIARDIRLATVLDCGNMYASNRDLRSTLLYTVKAAVAETCATCGYLMLAEIENKGPLVAEVAFSVEGEFDFPATLDFGFGLSGYVAKTGQPIAVRNATGDKHDFDGVSIGVKSALSVPLMTRTYSTVGRSADELILGVITLLSKEGDAFSTDDMDLVRTLASLAAVAVANARMEEKQHSTFVRTLESLATALEARDEYTRGHSQRVCEVSMLLGDRMGFSPEALEELRVGTVLHDIGKIGVPDAILNKRGRLDSAEFETMKSHTTIGYEICRPLMLSDGILMIIRNHHEKLDGSGYPDGLKGGELPLSLRIVCVADAFDAMSSRRPYRGVMDQGEVLAELSRNAGTQFDPVVVESLKELLRTDRMKELYAGIGDVEEPVAA